MKKSPTPLMYWLKSVKEERRSELFTRITSSLLQTGTNSMTIKSILEQLSYNCVVKVDKFRPSDVQKYTQHRKLVHKKGEKRRADEKMQHRRSNELSSPEEHDENKNGTEKSEFREKNKKVCRVVVPKENDENEDRTEKTESRSSEHNKKTVDKNRAEKTESRSLEHNNKTDYKNRAEKTESRSPEHNKKTDYKNRGEKTESRSPEHNKKTDHKNRAKKTESRSSEHNKKTDDKYRAEKTESRSSEHNKKIDNKNRAEKTESRSSEHNNKTDDKNRAEKTESRSSEHNKKQDELHSNHFKANKSTSEELEFSRSDQNKVFDNLVTNGDGESKKVAGQFASRSEQTKKEYECVVNRGGRPPIVYKPQSAVATDPSRKESAGIGGELKRKSVEHDDAAVHRRNGVFPIPVPHCGSARLGEPPNKRTRQEEADSSGIPYKLIEISISQNSGSLAGAKSVSKMAHSNQPTYSSDGSKISAKNSCQKPEEEERAVNGPRMAIDQGASVAEHRRVSTDKSGDAGGPVESRRAVIRVKGPAELGIPVTNDSCVPQNALRPEPSLLPNRVAPTNAFQPCTAQKTVSDSPKEEHMPPNANNPTAGRKQLEGIKTPLFYSRDLISADGLAKRLVQRHNGQEKVLAGPSSRPPQKTAVDRLPSFSDGIRRAPPVVNKEPVAVAVSRTSSAHQTAPTTLQSDYSSSSGFLSKSAIRAALQRLLPGEKMPVLPLPGSSSVRKDQSHLAPALSRGDGEATCKAISIPSTNATTVLSNGWLHPGTGSTRKPTPEKEPARVSGVSTVESASRMSSNLHPAPQSASSASPKYHNTTENGVHSFPPNEAVMPGANASTMAKNSSKPAEQVSNDNRPTNNEPLLPGSQLSRSYMHCPPPYSISNSNTDCTPSNGVQTTASLQQPTRTFTFTYGINSPFTPVRENISSASATTGGAQDDCTAIRDGPRSVMVAPSWAPPLYQQKTPGSLASSDVQMAKSSSSILENRKIIPTFCQTIENASVTQTHPKTNQTPEKAQGKGPVPHLPSGGGPWCDALEVARSFDELALAKISKMSQHLHIAIGEHSRKVENIKRTAVLTNNETYHERQKINKDYKYSVRLRSMDFEPLFSMIVAKFTNHKLQKTMVLYCKLLEQLVHLDASNTAYVYKLQEVIHDLLVAVKKHKDGAVLTLFTLDKEVFKTVVDLTLKEMASPIAAHCTSSQQCVVQGEGCWTNLLESAVNTQLEKEKTNFGKKELLIQRRQVQLTEPHHLPQKKKMYNKAPRSAAALSMPPAAVRPPPNSANAPAAPARKGEGDRHGPAPKAAPPPAAESGQLAASTCKETATAGSRSCDAEQSSEKCESMAPNDARLQPALVPLASFRLTSALNAAAANEPPGAQSKAPLMVVTSEPSKMISPTRFASSIRRLSMNRQEDAEEADPNLKSALHSPIKKIHLTIEKTNEHNQAQSVAVWKIAPRQVSPVSKPVQPVVYRHPHLPNILQLSRTAKGVTPSRSAVTAARAAVAAASAASSKVGVGGGEAAKEVESIVVVDDDDDDETDTDDGMQKQMQIKITDVCSLRDDPTFSFDDSEDISVIEEIIRNPGTLSSRPANTDAPSTLPDNHVSSSPAKCDGSTPRQQDPVALNHCSSSPAKRDDNTPRQQDPVALNCSASSSSPPKSSDVTDTAQHQNTAMELMWRFTKDVHQQYLLIAQTKASGEAGFERVRDPSDRRFHAVRAELMDDDVEPIGDNVVDAFSSYAIIKETSPIRGALRPRPSSIAEAMDRINDVVKKDRRIGFKWTEERKRLQSERMREWHRRSKQSEQGSAQQQKNVEAAASARGSAGSENGQTGTANRREETSGEVKMCWYASCPNKACVQCSGCQRACYCSPDCQNEDWYTVHAQICSMEHLKNITNTQANLQ